MGFLNSTPYTALQLGFSEDWRFRVQGLRAQASQLKAVRGWRLGLWRLGCRATSSGTGAIAISKTKLPEIL